LGVRLNKYLALSGVASRRHSDELIESGRVKINGKVALLGLVVNEGDQVTVDGKLVKSAEQKVYLMLNKPINYITTMSDDRNRPTVMQLLPKLPVRVFPVGRLDWDTEGILLFTNDGDLANKLMHPSNEVGKTYLATIRGAFGEAQLKKFKAGVALGDFTTSRAEAKIVKASGADTVVELTIHEGKNRQVRRMFEAIGCEVAKLKRVALGKLRLGELKSGAVRYLTEEEINYLCMA